MPSVLSLYIKCPICLDKGKFEDFGFLQCGHGGHEACLRNWRNMTCPVCRRRRNGNRLLKIHVEEPELMVDEEGVTEEERTDEALREQAEAARNLGERASHSPAKVETIMKRLKDLEKNIGVAPPRVVIPVPANPEVQGTDAGLVKTARAMALVAASGARTAVDCISTGANLIEPVIKSDPTKTKLSSEAINAANRALDYANEASAAAHDAAAVARRLAEDAETFCNTTKRVLDTVKTEEVKETEPFPGIKRVLEIAESFGAELNVVTSCVMDDALRDIRHLFET